MAFEEQDVAFHDEDAVLAEEVQGFGGIVHDHADDGVIDGIGNRNGQDVDFLLRQCLTDGCQGKPGGFPRIGRVV